MLIQEKCVKQYPAIIDLTHLCKTQRNLKMFFAEATESTKDFHSSPQAYWVTECFPTCASGGGGEGVRIVDGSNALAVHPEQTSKSGMKYLFGFDFYKLKSWHIIGTPAVSEQRQAQKVAGLWRTS